MFPREAKSIIELLANGIDPDSGEILPRKSVLNSPQVIRALFVAVEALDGAVKSAKRMHLQPSNIGHSWSDEEDRSLLAMFDSGALIKDIAAKHKRIRGAIHSRLLRFGKLDNGTKAGVDGSDFQADSSPQGSDESPLVMQSGSAGPSTSETEPLPIELASRNEYSFFEKLMERDQEIRDFLVQIRPIPKVNDLWIVGDGQSWGKRIEHIDAIKAEQDAIQRVADIFCEWMRDCADMAGDRKLGDLAHRFELKLKANPKDIFKLFSRVSKQRNKELIGVLQDFST